MIKKSSSKRATMARERIARIRQEIGAMDLLCSGSLSERMMKCGKPNCACATDPASRHGPYYEWVRMRANKPAHRYVTAEQAEVLRAAIAKHRQVKKLLRSWEEESEKIIDAEHPPKP